MRRLLRSALFFMLLLVAFPAVVQAEWVGSGSDRMYVNLDGSYASGLVDVDGQTYYFDPSTNKLTKNKWVTLETGTYYVGKSGYVYKNQWIDGKTYYVDETGKKVTGLKEINGKLYFFRLKNGKLRKGFFKYNGSRYYAKKKNGVIYRSRFFTLKKKKYYATETGALAVGIMEVGEDSYYFNEKGIMLKKKMVEVDGKTYFFLKKTGKMAKETWVKYKKKYYWFDKEGVMAKNQFVGDYYVGSDGARTDSKGKTGLKVVDGKIYYIGSDGQVVKDQWGTVDGEKYYFGSDGAAYIGLQTIGTLQYYFSTEGKLAVDTVVAVNGTAYRIAADGHIESVTQISGDLIAAYAQQFVGNPYVYGGTSLTSGADCSGFTMSVFANFGIKLLRVANDQLYGPSAAYQAQGYTPGTAVAATDLQPGDLVFYGAGGSASHVAIYIGGGKVCHAVNSRVGIKVTEMAYTGTPIGYMRYWT